MFGGANILKNTEQAAISGKLYVWRYGVFSGVFLLLKHTIMKKLIIISLVLLSIVELYRTGSASAFVLSLVVACQSYGLDIYKRWCRTFNR